MKPYDVLAHLPTWETASPAMIFDSPAWVFQTMLQGEAYALRKASLLPTDLLCLRLSCEDEAVVLGLADSPAFPELHALWAARTTVPEPILLALIERECGVIFQTLENSLRRQLAIQALEPNSEALGRAFTPFELTKSGEGVWQCTFTLALTPTLVEELGQIKHLDLAHESLREQMLPVQMELASFALEPAEEASMAAGDCLLLPEVDAAGNAPGRQWIVDQRFVAVKGLVELSAEDDLFHVLARAPLAVSFGDLCAGALPELPEQSEELVLVRHGKPKAYGRRVTLGDQQAFALEEVL